MPPRPPDCPPSGDHRTFDWRHDIWRPQQRAYWWCLCICSVWNCKHKGLISNSERPPVCAGSDVFRNGEVVYITVPCVGVMCRFLVFIKYLLIQLEWAHSCQKNILLLVWYFGVCIWLHTYTYAYIYVCLCFCTCLCICICIHLHAAPLQHELLRVISHIMRGRNGNWYSFRIRNKISGNDQCRYTVIWTASISGCSLEII